MFQLDFQYSFINKAWKTCQKTFQRLLLDPLPSFRVCDIDVDIRPPPPQTLPNFGLVRHQEIAIFDEGLRAKVGTKRG